jgi:sugar lactone lactonase YvrE
VADATADTFAAAEAEAFDDGQVDDATTVPFDAGAGVVVLASDQQGPSFMAIDGRNLYWTALDLGRTCIVRMPLAGGVPVTLARGPGSPFGLAVDDANVYWTESVPGGTGSVMSVPIDGGPSLPIAVGQVQPVGPAVTSTGLYWSANIGLDAGFVTRASLDGAAPSFVATGLNYPNAITADATSVYWLSAEGIMRAPLDGGPPVLLANALGSTPPAIAVDGNAVYTTISTCAIERTPLDGGPTGPLTTLQACPPINGGGIATDGTRVTGLCPSRPLRPSVRAPWVRS